MSPIERRNLERMWAPCKHPEQPTVQQHYARMRRQLQGRKRRHGRELNDLGHLLVAYGLAAMQREAT